MLILKLNGDNLAENTLTIERLSDGDLLVEIAAGEGDDDASLTAKVDAQDVAELVWYLTRDQKAGG